MSYWIMYGVSMINNTFELFCIDIINMDKEYAIAFFTIKSWKTLKDRSFLSIQFNHKFYIDLLFFHVLGERE